MTTTPKLSDTLRQARALISKPENWGKGVYRAPGPQFCLMGAVRHSIQGTGFNPLNDSYYIEIRRILIDAFTTEAFEQAAGPVAFNDLETTTHDDIISLLDRAIALAEEREAQA